MKYRVSIGFILVCCGFGALMLGNVEWLGFLLIFVGLIIIYPQGW